MYPFEDCAASMAAACSGTRADSKGCTGASLVGFGRAAHRRLEAGVGPTPLVAAGVEVVVRLAHRS